jgi:hypothetical protein
MENENQKPYWECPEKWVHACSASPSIDEIKVEKIELILPEGSEIIETWIDNNECKTEEN